MDKWTEGFETELMIGPTELFPRLARSLIR
jgi:hypothetical protein